jgi:hypothetical protein
MLSTVVYVCVCVYIYRKVESERRKVPCVAVPSSLTDWGEKGIGNIKASVGTRSCRRLQDSTPNETRAHQNKNLVMHRINYIRYTISSIQQYYRQFSSVDIPNSKEEDLHGIKLVSTFWRDLLKSTADCNDRDVYNMKIANAFWLRENWKTQRETKNVKYDEYISKKPNSAYNLWLRNIKTSWNWIYIYSFILPRHWVLYKKQLIPLSLPL